VVGRLPPTTGRRSLKNSSKIRPLGAAAALPSATIYAASSTSAPAAAAATQAVARAPVAADASLAQGFEAGVPVELVGEAGSWLAMSWPAAFRASVHAWGMEAKYWMQLWGQEVAPCGVRCGGGAGGGGRGGVGGGGAVPGLGLLASQSAPRAARRRCELP
jgi:hypothetical protein